MDFAPAVFSLVGVVIGTLGSVSVGYFTTRLTREQALAQERRSLRAEKQQFIVEYLREMQAFQDFVGGLLEEAEQGAVPPEMRAKAAERTTQLWFHQKKLLLVASEPLRQASMALTERLDGVLHGSGSGEADVWDLISPEQDIFLRAAREDLGIANSPVRG